MALVIYAIKPVEAVFNDNVAVVSYLFLPHTIRIIAAMAYGPSTHLSTFSLPIWLRWSLCKRLMQIPQHWFFKPLFAKRLARSPLLWSGKRLARRASLWRLCQQIHGELCSLPRYWHRCLALSFNRSHSVHTYLWAKRYPPALPIWLAMFWAHLQCLQYSPWHWDPY